MIWIKTPWMDNIYAPTGAYILIRGYGVISRTLIDAVGIFYNPCQLGIQSAMSKIWCQCNRNRVVKKGKYFGGRKTSKEQDRTFKAICLKNRKSTIKQMKNNGYMQYFLLYVLGKKLYHYFKWFNLVCLRNISWSQIIQLLNKKGFVSYLLLVYLLLTTKRVLIP